MPQGYGYGNARLRAMRSRLLTGADYDNLLHRTTTEEVITALTDTPYKNDVEVVLVRVGKARCVPEALRANLTRTLNHVRHFFTGEPKALADLLLRRWDRHNLLTILRGQSQEVSPESVLAAVIPVGQLDMVTLRELARQPGLRAVIDLMSTWNLPYARALRQVRARRGSVPDLDQLELALNHFHYDSLRHELGQGNGNRTLVRDTLQVEIDLLNIRTALRLARLPGIDALVQQRFSATNVRPLLVETGGQVSTGRLAQLVSESNSVEGMVHGLSDTRYAAALEAGWQRYQADGGSFVMMERELERWQANYMATMFTRNPLSIAIFIGYVGCKEIEVANLRLIARAVALDMKREQVQQELIIVRK